MDLKIGLVGSQRRPVASKASGNQVVTGRDLHSGPDGTSEIHGEAWRGEKESGKVDAEELDGSDEKERKFDNRILRGAVSLEERQGIGPIRTLGKEAQQMPGTQGKRARKEK